MQKYFLYAKKWMRAEMDAPVNTLRRTLLLRMARSSGLSQRRETVSSFEGIAALISSQDTSVIKQQKERAFKLLREAARSNNSRVFTRDLGAGTAPASLQLQLTAIGNPLGFRRLMSESDSTVK